MSIVKINDGKIQLSTGLSQETFAKTNLVLSLEEKGTIIDFSKNNEISEFRFSETLADSEKNIYFSGEMAGGTVLSEVLSKMPSKRSGQELKIIESAVKAIDFAIKNEIKLPCVGAGGIVATETKVLFLPEDLFDQCAFNSSTPAEHGKYIYKGLEGKSALIFLRSSIVYQALTGEFPFAEDEITARQTDMFDEKFLPIEYKIKNISENQANSINCGLKMKVVNIFKAGRRDFTNQKNLNALKELIRKSEEFDFGEFCEILKNPIPNENFEHMEKVAKFLKKQNTRVCANRFYRRNKNRIFASIAAVLLVCWMVNGFIKSNGKLATTKGLDSVQTTAVFYTMIHKADVPNLKETISGKKLEDLVLKVTGFYVSGKQREEFDASEATVRPAELLFYKENTRNWMYGISNLKIDGVSFPAESEFKRKFEKPQPISEENGNPLKKGEVVTHTAEYYLLHQEPNRIGIEKITDTVSLTWKGNRWLVTDISGTSKAMPVKTKDFAKDFYGMQENGVSLKETVEILREKYPWLPTQPDMETSAKFMLEKYGSKEAEKYLQNH
ncbi:MAG: hypothetical protein KBT11_06100 [Treponema sp.]|nr:hypothetical protein [Candidatus Treponema equifaecale]